MSITAGMPRVKCLALLGLSGLLLAPLALADSILGEGMREIENFRMRQLQQVQSDGNLETFTTDGCSGNLSKNWTWLANSLPEFKDAFGKNPPWENCCVEHDKSYWGGSTSDGYNQRINADHKLKQCVVDTGVRLAPELSARHSVSEENIEQTFALVADLMHNAVRLGGQPCSLLPWRWGYGWPNCAFATVSITPSNYSDIKTDEHVVFFNTAGWLNAEKTYWNIPVHAWIYEPADSVVRKGIFASILESSYELKITANTEENFSQRTNLLIADNERGKVIVIRVAGQDFTLPESQENGHIVTTLTLPVDIVNANADQNRLHFYAVTQPDEVRRFEGNIQLLADEGISLISDIDDTIKISNVTDHSLLFENTFFKDFRAAPGMADLYQQLSARGIPTHYVSSSPWQLYKPLQDFMNRSGFPWATLNLKAFRFRDETLSNLFKKGTETKPAQIEPLLQRYPQRKFVLVGDSGEQDPEVYGDIARRYSGQILRILIRNVDASTPVDERYQAAFKNLPPKLWRLFNYPEQINVDKLLKLQ